MSSTPEETRRRVLPSLILFVSLVALLVIASLLSRSGLTAPATPTLPPTPTSWPLPRRLDSPEYGINIHMWWDPWAAAGRDWRLIEEAGFAWVKQHLAWQDVGSGGAGHYDWTSVDRIVGEAEERNLNVLLRVDRPPAWAVPEAVEGEAPMMPVIPERLADFCGVLAERYKGRVEGYQVWNEPNLAREWGGLVPNPVGYVTLLRHCYVAIKSADPDALVFSASLAPTGSAPPEAVPDTDYLAAMYEAGAAPYFDLLGLNAPGYKAPPEVAPAEAADPANDYGGHRFFSFRHVEDMRAIMVEYGDGDKQVAILEFGWHTNNSPEHPDYAWFAVTPEQQADYLVRAFQYAHEHWSPWVGPMFVWNMPDSKWKPENEEFWWAIVDPFWWGFDRNFGTWEGSEVRPAYEALKEMDKP